MVLDKKGRSWQKSIFSKVSVCRLCCMPRCATILSRELLQVGYSHVRDGRVDLPELSRRFRSPVEGIFR